jgi:hypothetical protein
VMAARVSKFERDVVDAFKGSAEDFRNRKIETEDDFLASLYHHLRAHTDKNKIMTMLINHPVGDAKPAISIFKGADCLVVIEAVTITRDKEKIRPYDRSRIKSSMEKLKLCAPHSERGFLIHIDEGEPGFDDGFAEWKEEYYRNLWHEVEEDKTYLFEVKKGRTNKRRV